MKPKTSPIWNYFLQVSDIAAKCTICQKEYSRKGRTTTALKSHLRAVHPANYKKFQKEDEDLKKLLSNTQNEMLSIAHKKKLMKLQKSLRNKEFWSLSHEKTKQVDRLIAEMIAVHGLPFNLVESTEFSRLMKAAIPRYKLRGCQFFTSFVCDDLYYAVVDKTKLLLGEFEKISFTIDIWSKLNSGTSLLNFTAHGISKDFQKISVVLKCEVIEGCYTSESISRKFQSVLKEWGIKQEAIHCVILDRGASILKAMKLSGMDDFNCAINQIQYCIKNVIQSEEWLVELTAKLKKITNHFKHSWVALEELKKIQIEMIDQSELHFVRDSQTRWNNIYYMMEHFLKIKDYLILYLNSKQITTINSEDWLRIEKFLQILKPLEEITRELSSSQMTISSVIPLIQVVLNTLQKEEKKIDDSEEFIRLIRKIIGELNYRFCGLTNNFLCTISTYLDPRYKTKFFNELMKEEVKSVILELSTITDLDEENEDDCGSTSFKKKRNESGTTEHQKQPSTSWGNLSQLSQLDFSEYESDQQTNTISDKLEQIMMVKAMLHEYNNEERLSLDEDPLLWWNMNGYKYPALLPIVRRFLSAPPSSVASKHVLSQDSLIYNEKGNVLDEKKTSKVLFLKYNLPLFDFDD